MTPIVIRAKPSRLRPFYPQDQAGVAIKEANLVAISPRLSPPYSLLPCCTFVHLHVAIKVAQIVQEKTALQMQLNVTTMEISFPLKLWRTLATH